MSAGRIFLRDVKITTIDRTKPPSAPSIQGRIEIWPGAVVDVPPRVHTQPTAANATSTAKSPTVFQTVSSTDMRPVSMAPAGGAAYMPSSWAWAAASVPARWAVEACVCAGGGVKLAAWRPPG